MRRFSLRPCDRRESVGSAHESLAAGLAWCISIAVSENRAGRAPGGNFNSRLIRHDGLLLHMSRCSAGKGRSCQGARYRDRKNKLHDVSPWVLRTQAPHGAGLPACGRENPCLGRSAVKGHTASVVFRPWCGHEMAAIVTRWLPIASSKRITSCLLSRCFAPQTSLTEKQKMHYNGRYLQCRRSPSFPAFASSSSGHAGPPSRNPCRCSISSGAALQSAWAAPC